MDLEQFLKLNGIDMRDFIEANDSPDLVVYEKYDNSIANYAMYGNYEAENVDISSVIGIPRHLIQRKSVVENFALLFDPRGDEYHSRANGMLKYSSSNLLKGLEYSFKREPIRMYKINGKYFISSNGAHRFHLFKMHYLMSLFKGENVEGKYTFPALVEELDYIKTYVNYISSLLWDESFEIRYHYNENYRKTGKVVVSYKGEQMIMDDQELVSFLRERMQALKALDESYYTDVVIAMWNKVKWEETGLFMEFMNEYFPEMTHVLGSDDYACLESRIKEELIEGVQYGNS